MQKKPGFSGFNPSGLFWVIAPATGLSGGPAGAGGVATVGGGRWLRAFLFFLIFFNFFWDFKIFIIFIIIFLLAFIIVYQQSNLLYTW